MTSIANALRLELEPQKVRVTEVVIGRTATEFSEKRLGAAGRSGGGLPVMPPTKVAEAIVGVIGNDRDVVTLRWIDRLMLLGNALVPKWIGRRALKQYK
jgi:short-subunit dehydrogenase